MAFDKNGFVSWLTKRDLRAAPTVYPHSLEKMEEMGRLSLKDYVPSRTKELLGLLKWPSSGRFQGRSKSGLRDWQACVRSYDSYVRQRDGLLPLVESHTTKTAIKKAVAAQKSNFILGLWKDKMYLAPDAFSPEEYPERQAG